MTMATACTSCDTQPIQMVSQPPVSDAVQLSVPQMRCAACISAIENALCAMSGVEDARVNLSLKRVQVETNRPPTDLITELARIGYEAFPLDAEALGTVVDQTGRDLLLRIGIAGFTMMNVMLLSVAVWSGAEGATRDLFHLISAAIALPAVLYAAQPFFKHAAQALRVGRLNMDVPISLAILLAGAMSLYETLHGGAHAYFDAALSLTFFLLIGRYLEHRTRAAARSAAKELAALEVHTAERKRGGVFETVPRDALAPGDVVLVASGQRVPVDGSLLAETALCDRSFLSGESAPVSHAHNATLNAGETNLGAAFEMRAVAVGQDTRLHQIARLVDTAENARNRYTSLADRAAQIYAPAVHLLALATFLGWWLTTGDLRHSLNVAIAVLIITCPCALGLAVPAVSTAAISCLYRMGFLVKSGTALERLAECETVVLDKTGTLTRPGFTFDPEELDTATKGVVKALAQTSAHPLSRALSRVFEDAMPVDLTDIQETKAYGVSAVANGVTVALGRADWLGAEGDGLVLKVGHQTIELPYEDATVAGAGEMVGGFETQGMSVEIVSGDTEVRTAELSEELGVGSYRSGLMPEDKNARISELEAAGSMPCMFGDGLNDTIALAQAHASIAPGTALDAARNAADVVVLRKSLDKVPELFVIARRAVALSRQNFGISIAYNAVAIPIAIAGYATPLVAALAMSLSSITVLLNAVRVKGTS